MSAGVRSQGGRLADPLVSGGVLRVLRARRGASRATRVGLLAVLPPTRLSPRSIPPCRAAGRGATQSHGCVPRGGRRGSAVCQAAARCRPRRRRGAAPPPPLAPPSAHCDTPQGTCEPALGTQGTSARPCRQITPLPATRNARRGRHEQRGVHHGRGRGCRRHLVSRGASGAAAAQRAAVACSAARAAAAPLQPRPPPTPSLPRAPAAAAPSTMPQRQATWSCCGSCSPRARSSCAPRSTRCARARARPAAARRQPGNDGRLPAARAHASPHTHVPTFCRQVEGGGEGEEADADAGGMRAAAVRAAMESDPLLALKDANECTPLHLAIINGAAAAAAPLASTCGGSGVQAAQEVLPRAGAGSSCSRGGGGGNQWRRAAPPSPLKPPFLPRQRRVRRGADCGKGAPRDGLRRLPAAHHGRVHRGGARACAGGAEAGRAAAGVWR